MPKSVLKIGLRLLSLLGAFKNVTQYPFNFMIEKQQGFVMFTLPES